MPVTFYKNHKRSEAAMIILIDSHQKCRQNLLARAGTRHVTHIKNPYDCLNNDHKDSFLYACFFQACLFYFLFSLHVC